MLSKKKSKKVVDKPVKKVTKEKQNNNDFVTSISLKTISKNKFLNKNKFKFMRNRESVIKILRGYSDILTKPDKDGIDRVNQAELKQLFDTYSKVEVRRILIQLFNIDSKVYDDLSNCLERIVAGEELESFFDKSNVLDLLRKHITSGETERKEFGEVQTPPSLIENMLDTLPEEVWSNPGLTWFDGCAGVGGFHACIVKRLMNGLTEFQPDVKLRYKHIVENMLYTCELQVKNLFIHMCTFDLLDEYDLNVYQGSFLEGEFDHHMRTVWGLEKFDIIVGNPPYQELKDGNTKAQAIWHFFVKKSIEILNNDGYLVYVHPSGWRNPYGSFKDINKLFVKLDLKYLEIHDINDGIKTFGASTRYDFYCLKNSSTKDNFTLIKYQDGSILSSNIRDMFFIPNEKYSEFESILSTDKNNKIQTIYNRNMYDIYQEYVDTQESEKNKYPVIKYVSKTKELPDLFWSDRNLGHFGIPKVIFGIGAQVGRVLVDDTGKYGMYAYSMGIVGENKDELENIKTALESEKFKNLMKACQFNTEMYNRKIISMFKKDFYKEFI